MTIGARIKNKREECDMTLRELSDRTGISKAMLSRYETGSVKTIPSDRLEILADALMTSPKHLMGWDNLKERSQCNMSEMCDQNTMKKYMRLDEEDRIRIQERIDMLLESDKYLKKRKSSMG